MAKKKVKAKKPFLTVRASANVYSLIESNTLTLTLQRTHARARARAHTHTHTNTHTLSGSVYEGGWKFGKREGKGTETYYVNGALLGVYSLHD